LILERQFDRIMVSESMLVDGEGNDWCFEKIEVLRDAIVRGRPDGPAHWSQRLALGVAEFDLSDHYPVMATFELR
ncbi:MAG: endonuclease, partial [Aureliella sp.]